MTAAVALAGAGPAQGEIGDPRPGAEAAFVKVGPIDYTFIIPLKKDTYEVPFTTTESKMFYTFQPADNDTASTPLFVFLNGGPGAATTANFFANNTAPYTLNLKTVKKDPAGVVKNPNSWTQLGNLLYIDPSQSGFSYNVSEDVFADPEYGSVLQKLWTEYWNEGNFNAFIDADQILRVLLTFLKTHPDLAKREVIMVGESYGGVRVSTILHMLMNSAAHDNGGSSFFRDPGMAAMIREHFGTGTAAPTPEQVSKQFDRQILVQPQLSSYQDEEQGRIYWNKNSVIADVAKAAGKEYKPSDARCLWFVVLTKNQCVLMDYVKSYGRDRYDWAQPLDYSDLQDAYANQSMRGIPILTTMLGVDPSSITGLRASERGKAYHTMGFPVIGDDEKPTKDMSTLKGKFGTLDAPDSYYLSWNKYAYAASTRNLGSVVRDRLPLSPDNDPIYGNMFLENLKYVRTFLTDADRDLVIYSKAMAPALRRHTDLVKDVSTREETTFAFGQMSITWKNGTQTNIRWPFYKNAGHAVAMTMADKLLSDVSTWLTGSDSRWASQHLRWKLGGRTIQKLRTAGVRVRPVRPAEKSHSSLLLPAKGTRVITAKGGVRMRTRTETLTIRRIALKGQRVEAAIGGKKVRLLKLSGGKHRARLTAAGAMSLNAGLAVRNFRPGMSMGWVADRTR